MKGMVDGEKLSKEFMGAYHEKQIGSLCAVHCMNNLLQGPYFDFRGRTSFVHHATLM
ncbi:hypothetical protein T484DRAFT_1835000 [Baffinella frigidus]|nr:hypothetical protein T484DRAFT_1835000 [Cryptophyta sp. CCMP2293]